MTTKYIKPSVEVLHLQNPMNVLFEASELDVPLNSVEFSEAKEWVYSEDSSDNP